MDTTKNKGGNELNSFASATGFPTLLSPCNTPKLLTRVGGDRQNRLHG